MICGYGHSVHICEHSDQVESLGSNSHGVSHDRAVTAEAKRDMAMRRGLLVPRASPMFGVVGSWSPLMPSTYSLELQVRVRLSDLGLHLVCPFLQTTLPCARSLFRSPPSACV